MIKVIVVIAAFLLVLPALALITIVLFVGGIDDDYDQYIEKKESDKDE